MRVVAGELGGRRLVAPLGASTRPTSDKVREAVFNSLDSAGLIDGAAVLDLFAGSGAMGIEALSRGAARCDFVEHDARALDALRQNLDALGLAARARVHRVDALRGAPRAHFDLAIADPPYQFDKWPELIAVLDADVLVAESDREIEPVDGWELVRARRYGRTFVTQLRQVA